MELASTWTLIVHKTFWYMDLASKRDPPHQLPNKATCNKGIHLFSNDIKYSIYINH